MIFHDKTYYQANGTKNVYIWKQQSYKCSRPPFPWIDTATIPGYDQSQNKHQAGEQENFLQNHM